MIGAILARRQARATFARLNAHDLEGFMRAIADDAVFDFPGQTDLSGHHVGKSAVRVYFHTMLDRFPQIRFTLRHVGVENILAVSGTNTLLVEWDLDYTNRAGRTFHNSGVTSAIAKGGKIVRLRDYLFDLVALAAANAPESDAPGSRPAQASESGDRTPPAYALRSVRGIARAPGRGAFVVFGTSRRSPWRRTGRPATGHDIRLLAAVVGATTLATRGKL
jgi:ketosteroid isomerase-like protein